MADTLTTDIVNAYEKAHLPDEVKALPLHKRVAWECLGNGMTIREAAARAGVSKSTLWQWMQREPMRSARGALLVGHLDDAVATVGNALSIGKAATEAQDVGNGLRAAKMVFDGLGIGGTADHRAHARTSVKVTLHVSGALGQDSSSSMPTIDVTPDDQ